MPLNTYLLPSGKTLVVASMSYNEDNNILLPTGSGIVWSINSGNDWHYIEQAVDPSGGYLNTSWYTQSYNYKGTNIELYNLSYGVAADVINKHIYSASWAGLLRRFKYTDSNPEWEVVPLPMDNQDVLECDGIDNYSYSYNLYQNHKPFSVDVFNDYIWVGTAYGINRGHIASTGPTNSGGTTSGHRSHPRTRPAFTRAAVVPTTKTTR